MGTDPFMPCFPKRTFFIAVVFQSVVQPKEVFVLNMNEAW